MVRGSARSQGWDPAAPPLGHERDWAPEPRAGNPNLDPEIKEGWDRREMLTATSRGSSLGIQKATKSNVLSIYFSILWSVSSHPLPCPSLWMFISLLQILLQGSVPLEAPLQQPWPLWGGWGCFTAIPWIQTLGDKEETVSRSFHVSPSCLPIRVKIWFHSWKVPLFQ